MLDEKIGKVVKGEKEKNRTRIEKKEKKEKK